ncbi:MAG: carboxypeptidase-like regulatory domain-containing protein [Bacteroidetes bacterium]|nr:MAG: carboxypeptidase-like regulatory domain-containing protein [Bacteroidota bacterium]
MLTAFSVSAQYKIKGIVYDSSRNNPMQSVSVLTTSGRGTVTNSEGFYEVEVSEKDSIWFSYLNKPTIKFPVMKIADPFSFDISLQVNVPVLKEVKIRPRDYKLDSIQNRQDYAKVFNYKKPGLKTNTSNYGAGVGFDLDEIINVFRFRRNRSMAAFQKRLLEEEKDKFVDHRFSKALVRRLTQLNSSALDSFMLLYRPSYMFTLLSTDYEFQQFIKQNYLRFKRGLSPLPLLKEEEDEL